MQKGLYYFDLVILSTFYAIGVYKSVRGALQRKAYLSARIQKTISLCLLCVSN